MSNVISNPVMPPYPLGTPSAADTAEPAEPAAPARAEPAGEDDDDYSPGGEIRPPADS